MQITQNSPHYKWLGKKKKRESFQVQVADISEYQVKLMKKETNSSK